MAADDSIEFQSADDVERFLVAKPREWIVMLAARAALRAVPLLAAIVDLRSKRPGAQSGVLLPLLRGIALPWLVGRHGQGEVHVYAGVFRAAANAAYAVFAADAVSVATSAAAAASAAARAAHPADEVDQDYSVAANLAAAAAASAAVSAAAADDAAWTALRADALALMANGPAMLASAPLWPERQAPPTLKAAWQEFEDAMSRLEGAADWRSVWFDWCKALHDGRRPWNLPHEAGVRILGKAMLWPDADWDKGALHINPRIAALIEAEREKPKELAPLDKSDTSVLPPAEPLPEQNSAVRFGVVAGKVEVLPTQAWAEQAPRAEPYFNRAVQLAEGLHARLQGSNAAPDVAGSVAALLAVLGGKVEQVEPDLLRMAARSIASKARSYGHPQAEWELNPDAVSELFELDGALVDLQSFVRGAVAANEAEIRALDLEPDQAVAIKQAVDELSDAIIAEPALFSAETQAVFASAAIAGDTALDPVAALAIQASRLLVAESLTRTLALEVARSAPVAARQGASSTAEAEPVQEEVGASAPPARQPPRKRKAAAQADAQAWSRFTTRLLDRIGKNGPDKIGDAVIEAVCSAIRHAPKTIPAVGAALVALLWSNPVLAASSGLTISASWIGYELWRRSRQPK